MIRGLLIALSTIWASAALSETLDTPGIDAPEFLEAKAAWLDGDDMVALTALAHLSRGGNTAAQLLLARIAEEPHMHRQVTGDMTRAEKIALLRQPGGLSGTSWLDAATEEAALARYLVIAKQGYTSVTRDDGSQYSPEADLAVSGLTLFGETELATEVVFKLHDGFFLDETLDLLVTYEEYLDPMVEVLKVSLEQSADAFAIMSEGGSLSAETQTEYADQRDVIAPAHRLATAGFGLEDIKSDAGLQDFIRQHAENVGAWTPLRHLCETSCPESYSDCLLAGATSMTAGRLFPFASPLQLLVSTEEYWKSARMRGDAARRMAEIGLNFDAAKGFDQCFAETVTALVR
ncbi:MAG: hypothetical protein P8L68_01640 [Paracoccaceae bacterium]|nr:hypothetical protein [Paracoccaceae bacterium]